MNAIESHIDSPTIQAYERRIAWARVVREADHIWR